MSSSSLDTISDSFVTHYTNLEQLKRHHKSEAEAVVFAFGGWLPKAKIQIGSFVILEM